MGRAIKSPGGKTQDSFCSIWSARRQIQSPVAEHCWPSQEVQKWPGFVWPLRSVVKLLSSPRGAAHLWKRSKEHSLLPSLCLCQKP